MSTFERGAYGLDVTFEIEPRPYDDADVVRLVAEVQAWYAEVYGGPDAAVLTAEEFRAPNGLLLVGVLDGEAVAMGGWRRLPRTAGADLATAEVATGEIKRMYTSPRAQRRGLARLVLAEVERTAAAAGVERLVLNTGRPQAAAIAMYEAAGYVPADPFGLYADEPGAVFFGKQLSGTQS